jgi:hypothetical protein
MSELKPGTHVTHKLFGSGVVRNVSGSGPSAKITVDFAANVGQKKLIASVANLVKADTAEDAPPSSLPPPVSHWFETLDVTATLAPGRKHFEDPIHATLRNGVGQPEFWLAVREKLRARGIVPRVLDEPNGRISLGLSGLLRMRLVVQHSELVRHADAVLARAIFDVLAERHLTDFRDFRFSIDVRTDGELVDADLVEIGNSDSGPLPDRSPLRRALPVTPKGVIKSRPKRRDDY